MTTKGRRAPEEPSRAGIYLEWRKKLLPVNEGPGLKPFFIGIPDSEA
jgi:hypothetical protein